MKKGNLLKKIKELRRRNTHCLPSLRVKSEAGAAKFIEKVGFCLLFPLNVGARIEPLPSLYDAACGGDRRLMAGWSETMQRLWTWKDEIAAHKKAFFGKFFKGRPSFISLEFLPDYFSLSGNYGSLEDYQEVYEDGRITPEAKKICDVLYEKGSLPTVRLRREAGLRGKRGGYRFERAIRELQKSLLVANVGIYEGESAWPSIIVDLLPRIFPEAVKKSKKIQEEEARKKILQKYLDIVVVIHEKDVSPLLSWEKEKVYATLQSLLKEKRILLERGGLFMSWSLRKKGLTIGRMTD